MWPMPAITHKFVAIIFAEDVLSCYWILRPAVAKALAGRQRSLLSLTKYQDDRKMEGQQLVVRAYKQYPLNNLELTHLTLFNSTIIKQYITSFLSEHDLSDAFVAFALHGSAVHEKFVTMPTSTPHRTDFTMQDSAHLLWEYRYLYPNDDGQFVFYVYSVPRSVVLQYKLLAVAAQCNLITMTTQTMALLSAYEHMFGSAFRRTQLGVDMMRCNNNIGDLITIDALKRMVDISAVKLAKDDYLQCMAAAGLFYSEKV